MSRTSKTQEGAHTYDSRDIPFVDDFNDWLVDVLVGNPEDCGFQNLSLFEEK